MFLGRLDAPANKDARDLRVGIALGQLANEADKVWRRGRRRSQLDELDRCLRDGATFPDDLGIDGAFFLAELHFFDCRTNQGLTVAVRDLLVRPEAREMSSEFLKLMKLSVADLLREEPSAICDLNVELRDLRQGVIPASFESASDDAILRLDRVVLALDATRLE